MRWWERWRIPLMLTPTLAVILLLFGGGLLYGVIVSLGYNPRIGNTTFSLDAYHTVLFGEQYTQQFWVGLCFTFWISIASTVISAVLAVLIALTIRSTGFGQRTASFMLQFNLPIPHLVAAIGMLFLLSQSGLLARAGAAAGFIERPNEFPILVRDSLGLGIIITYVWKEVPFIGIIVLAVLQSLGKDYEDAALNLGANQWQRFRYVTLPLILPALLSASVIVFAFTFGAYEVPEILGVRYPEALPVMAIDLFNQADLNERSNAMALSVIISSIVMVLVAFYMWLRDWANKRQ
ncbi:MAG: ABC transporter permease subunit [Chloroflexota bacterium]